MPLFLWLLCFQADALSAFEGGLLVSGFDGEIIHPFVLGVPCVPLDPMKMDRVLGREFVELFPEIYILHGLLGSGLPSLAFPPRQPFIEPFEDILRIGVEFNDARAGQGGEPFDDGCEFHAIVGGVGLAAVAFDGFAGLGVSKQKRPPPRPGVARAGAIGVEFDGWTIGI